MDTTGSALRADVLVSEFLAHHGVKGMKWGVRKDKGHEGEQASNRKIKRLDKKFERSTKTLGLTLKLHNAAASAYNKHDLERINNKKQYKDQDFKRDSPLRRKYYDEHQKAFLDRVEQAAKDLGTNASGTRRYSIVDNGTSWDVITDSTRRVRHAEGDEVLLTVKVKFGPDGEILGIELPDEEMAQSALVLAHAEEIVSDTLAHFGVKGMKWGVRRDSAPTAPAHEDHAAAEAARAKMKAGGAHTLSNKEFEALLNRMNLEQRFYNLNDQKRKQVSDNKFKFDKYKGIAKKALESPGGKLVKDEAGKAIRKGATKIILKSVKNEGASKALKLALGKL